MREGYLGFLDSWMITALICLNKEAAFGLAIPIGGALSLITMMVSGGRALENVHCFTTITMGHARITNPDHPCLTVHLHLMEQAHCAPFSLNLDEMG